MRNGKSENQRWKNFLSLWERNSGALQASGVLNLESLCRVMKDQGIATTDQARDLYRILRSILGEDMSIAVACWSNQNKSGKQPDYQVGYNPPKGDGNGKSGGKEEVPF